MKTMNWYFLFLTLVFVFCEPVWARTLIGKVSKMRGMVTKHFVNAPVINRLWSDDVFMQRRQMQKDFIIEGLYEGAPIYEGDEVRTEKSSYLQVNLLDKTKISLTAQSVFVFTKFEKVNDDKRKAVFHHVWGQVRAKFVKKADDGDLRFSTPHASFGIRGTEFISDVGIINHQREQMNLALLEGELQVEGEGYVKNMKAGELVRTDAQGLVDMIELSPHSLEEMLRSPAHERQVLVDFSPSASPLKNQQVLPKIIERPAEMLIKKKKNWQEILHEQQEAL